MFFCAGSGVRRVKPYCWGSLPEPAPVTSATPGNNVMMKKVVKIVYQK